MTLVAFGELRDINTGEQLLFARFAKEDGQTFDLPISEEQFELLAQNLGMVEQTAQVPAPKGTSAAPRPAPRVVQEDEDEEIEDLRIHRLAVAAVDDDL